MGKGGLPEGVGAVVLSSLISILANPLPSLTPKVILTSGEEDLSKRKSDTFCHWSVALAMMTSTVPGVRCLVQLVTLQKFGYSRVNRWRSRGNLS